MPEVARVRGAARAAVLGVLSAGATLFGPTVGGAGAAPAPPVCLNPTLIGHGAYFGARANPSLAGQSVSFDGSCSRVTADIGLSSVPPDTYNWDFGDGSSNNGTTAAPSHVYARAGTYTVTLTVSGNYSGGQTWTTSQQVYVLG